MYRDISGGINLEIVSVDFICYSYCTMTRISTVTDLPIIRIYMVRILITWGVGALVFYFVLAFLC